MPIRTTLILATVTAMLLCDGCASSRRSAMSQTPAPSTQITIGPATRPAQPADAKSNLRLVEIQPVPALPATQPASTQPFRAPLEALELYARARDALASGHQFTAIGALERAVKLDPGSPELYRLLSRAYVAAGNVAKALEMLERATQLAPDDLRSQTALARMYLQRGNAADAMDHLRMGLQTRQYTDDEAAAAVADYFLARALQQQGYDRAALEQYEKLLDRLTRRTLALRSDAELADWSARPQALFSDVARLYEKQGQYRKALDAWRQVANFDANDLETRSHIIDMLIATGDNEAALSEAAMAVRQSGATSRALEILRDVAHRIGQENAVYEELHRLTQERPDDRSLLFATVDLLSGDGRDAEAQAMLEQAARSKFDSEIVRRLVRFYSDHGKTVEATKLLIEAATAKPDDTPTLVQLYAGLLQPMRRDSLRPSAVQRIEVAPAAEPAKQYFLAITAANNREMLSREALDKSTQLEPLFPPAYRLAITRLAERSDLDTAAKDRAADALIDRARRLGPPGFAQELLALRLATKQSTAEAIAAFEESFNVRAPSPEPAIIYVNLLEQQGNQAKIEQALGRLIRDYPTYGPAYLRLIAHHLKPGGSAQAALNTLQRWRAADPSSTTARLTEAQLMARAGQTRDMLRRLIELINENPQDAEVLSDASNTLRATKQTAALTQALEDQLARNPKNLLLALQLVQTYEDLNRADDASRVVEKVRIAAEGDSRLMYLVGQLYSRINQKQKSRDALAESLRLDPTDAATNNDLGYTWAEDGINLDRAEAMTRRAVEAEPDNGSFLDSLGWVLYKRGEFAEARRHLERAISVGDDASMPVVLDHLGDTLYRLNDSAGAQAQWQKSLEKLVLTPGRADTDGLRPLLEGKIRQAQMGEPVNVSPVSIEPTSATPFQAKN